jgi:anti-anti-sigma factor
VSVKEADNKIIETDCAAGITVVRVLPRRIFLELADKFREEMLRLVRESTGPLVLDLSQVSVMNSTALGTLVVMSEAMKKAGRPFYIARPGRVLREVINRMRLDLLLTIRDDLEGVYRELQRGGGGQTSEPCNPHRAEAASSLPPRSSSDPL